MEYLAFRFDVQPAQPGSDILIAHLGQMGFESFEQDDNGFNAYVQAERAGELPLDELEFPGITFQWTASSLPDTNWNAEWEKNFEPVVIDDLLCIRASFHKPRHQCKYEIVITPKMSFGTGHHETTRLMCRIIYDLSPGNRTVADIGCGTGVLAILAAKLGASQIVAVDNDSWSVTNARENCMANNCAGIEVLEGDISVLGTEKKFDIVLANINRNILLRHLPAYARHTLPGATLVLSGFFVTDCDELENAAAIAGFSKNRMVADGEWAALVFVRK